MGMLERLARLRSRKKAASGADAGGPEAAMSQRLDAVEKRLEHLEAMVEGLQDSVHRESVRQAKKIDELQKSADPAAIRRALERDAREHGL
jgi:hypothetical protein